MAPRFFRTAVDFRRWLSRHHASAPELWLGFYRKDSGRTGIGYREALDEALCMGWIDGLKKRVDDDSYQLRFTPRRPDSIWSAVNTKRYRELDARGRVRAPGRAAFARRDAAKTPPPASRRAARLAPSLERVFRGSPAAWMFFRAQPQGYMRTAIGWIMAAVRQDTRERRLAALVAASAAGRRLGVLIGKSDRA